MDQSRYTSLFLSDSRDHLHRCTALLLAWERAPETTEPVAELFRAFHSIKGAAGAMGLEPIALLAHAAEHVLEAVRRGHLSGSPQIVALLLQGVDLLSDGVERVAQGERLPETAGLAAALGRLAASGTPSTVGAPRVPSPAPSAPRLSTPGLPRRQAPRAVRIDPARLDELMNQVGELVVARNRLEALVGSQIGTELEAVGGRIASLVRAMHDGVLRARLAPLAELFDRFPRVVRDLGKELGKSVRLELHGEGIELDRGMLEELVDPIIHLLRNAVDHGIEPAADRVARGKPAEGTVRIRASRERDTVVLRVADDGRGVDRRGVAQLAVRQGLLETSEARLNDSRLLAILARPGFSLKHELTTVSGRGVGIDAAALKVRSLGGRLDLSTREGEGTTFTLTLPLTTAIQRVLLVGVPPERFAIPIRLLAEAVLPDQAAGLSQDGRWFTFRTERLPVADLRAVAGLATGPATDRRPVLVLDWGERRAALVVDRLLGQQDAVVERVAEPAGMPRWLSGATVLPDGAPAFLLDPTALF